MNAALFFYLLITFGISWFNAYQGGKYWTEVKLIGGGPRVLVWSAVIMAAVGFSWVYLTLVAVIGIATEKLTEAEAKFLMDVGYVILVPWLLGSGFVIWANSLIRAWRERTLGTTALAGWNTGAQFYNTWQAASEVPDILGDIFDALLGKGSRKSGKGASGAVLIILAIIVISSGVTTTWLIAKHADKEHALDVTSNFT